MLRTVITICPQHFWEGDDSVRLEVEAHFRCECSRSYVVGAAKRRQKVVESVFVGDVDAGQSQASICMSRYGFKGTFAN